MREFGYKNMMQVPRLEKIIINVGIGREVTSSDNSGKIVEATTRDIAAIAGQKPVVTMSKKAIAAFKLRKGQPVGVMVTLRGARMYEFFDKLVNVTLPRLRDFQGSSDSSFDGRGAYQLGMREQTLFPEIEYTAVDKLRGLQINIVTTADSKEKTKRLLEVLGMPFAKKQEKPAVDGRAKTLVAAVV
jgi:large subunit ribosomal protein L5